MKKSNYKILIFFLLFYQFFISQTPPHTQDDTLEINTDCSILAPSAFINDTGQDNSSLFVLGYTVNGVSFTNSQTASLTEEDIILNADVSYTFVPKTNYTGSIPLMEYTISDGTSERVANLDFRFITSLIPPIAKDDFDTVEINTPLNVIAPGVLINDTNEDSNSLFIEGFTVNGIPYSPSQKASLFEGEITLNTDGSYIFIPSPDYFGDVSRIKYTISDGTFRSTAYLYLTVEKIKNLLEIEEISSCNQGYTIDGDYKIQYNIKLTNISTARDYHVSNLIKKIDLTNDLDAIYGSGCSTLILQDVSTSTVQDFIENPYPLYFDNDAINRGFLDGTSTSIFNANAINTFTLYPRQSIDIQFCVTVDAFCGGPNPTPSGSGVDFDTVLKVTSTRGDDTKNLLLTDFHTQEAVVSAGLFIPIIEPPVNPDATYDFTNTVIITNKGTALAENINYTMGLGVFLKLPNVTAFNQLTVTQVSGPPVTVNTSYDGDTNTQLLAPNNDLAPGATIILEVFYILPPTCFSDYVYFEQLVRSQTQGILDGTDELDENTLANKRDYSFVTWSDNAGDHLDRYYITSSATEPVSSKLQCYCDSSEMRFYFDSFSSIDKKITNTNEAPNGILEHQEITFQLTVTNTSKAIQLEKLQLKDDLNAICGGSIISVSAPFIENSTASLAPNLNNSFNGRTDINFFDGISGLLMANESVTIQFSVVFSENCIGDNRAIFLAKDPLNNVVSSSDFVTVNASTDIDEDGVTNFNDIDDDNDTLPDIEEYNGLNPLDDHDTDFIPNYRDIDFGADINNDGIIDLFDFDMDGVPNHFDLDSDNDGVLDIVEVENISLDTNNNGRTNSLVGANGLDDSVENNDTFTASINYSIPNTDAHGNANFIDIDADGDGIVDNIESQTTDNYISRNTTVTTAGIDTAYPNGISPIDTDNDAVFDYMDTNSDNDALADAIEGWDTNGDGVAETVASYIDFDTDGLDDAFDTNTNLADPTNGQTPTDFPNIDNADTTERDWREIIAVFVLINNVTKNESEDLVFEISLVTKKDNSIFAKNSFPIVINFSTSDGSNTTNIYDLAIAPFDYNEITNVTVTIPPSPFIPVITKFIVRSLEDNIYEIDELFTLNGTITSNNTININTKGIGTIKDNDAPPFITMNNSKEGEGTDLVHTITLSNPSSKPIGISVNTNDALATSPDDYITISENLTIEGTIDPNNANIDASFNITTLKDNLNELDEETLNVIGTLLTTTTAIGTQDLIKTGTIIDLDPNPLMVIEGGAVLEGDPLLFTISLLNSNLEPMQNYLPLNFNLQTLDDTAYSLEDFQPFAMPISIPAYEFSIKKSVETINDRLSEKTEVMKLHAFFNSINIVSNTSPIIGVGTIKDDDFPNLFSPNSDGKSDLFKILGIEDSPKFKLVIYDRWGSEVYNYSNDGRENPVWWNGERNGKPVPAGVYYYILNFNDGATKARTNFIQLIR